MDTERRDWTIEKKGFLSSYKKYIVRKQNRAARQQAPLYFTLFKYFLNSKSNVYRMSALGSLKCIQLGKILISVD